MSRTSRGIETVSKLGPSVHIVVTLKHQFRPPAFQWKRSSCIAQCIRVSQQVAGWSASALLLACQTFNLCLHHKQSFAGIARKRKTKTGSRARELRAEDVYQIEEQAVRCEEDSVVGSCYG